MPWRPGVRNGCAGNPRRSLPHSATAPRRHRHETSIGSHPGLIHDEPKPPSAEIHPTLIRSALPRISFGRSKQGDYIFYLAVVLAATASWVVALLPRLIVDKLAQIVAWLSYKRASRYRDNVRSNLSHVF